MYFFLNLPLPPTASGPGTDFKAKLRRIDFGGAITLISAVFLLLLGLDRAGDIGWNNRLTISLFIGFGIFTAAFGAIEARFATEPFAPTRITVNRALVASYMVNFFGIAGAFSQLFHISLYIQAVLGKSASETGAWLVVAVLTALTGSLGGGLIMQSTGKYYALTCLGYVVLLSGTLTVLFGTGFAGLPRSSIEVILGALKKWNDFQAFYLRLLLGLALTAWGNGCGITTSLISLIANAGQADQAIATAGLGYFYR